MSMISESLLPEFDNEIATTRRVLERVPTDKFEYKPHDKSMSMVQLATHISNMLMWTVMTLKEDSFDVAPPGGEPYHEEPAASSEALLKSFDSNAAVARAAIAEANDGQWMESWSLKSGGNAIMTMPRVAVIRGFVMNHVIHHRGQLSVYLRLNDIPVPSIYGPSADDSGGM
ncbi:MAG: DinB family protein [Blastocatellia bacterium]